MSELVFRAVDPRNDEDMKKYFEIAEKLSKFLKNGASFNEDQMRWARIRMGAIEYVDLNDWVNRPLEPIENNAQEFAFVCEKDGEFAGYVDLCDYHVVDGKPVDDEIGVIHEIYVDKKFRKNHKIAEELLKLAVDKLISKGKTKSLCNVQEDNDNRFLHFAMADKIMMQGMCERTDGSMTKDYTLIVDLNKLQNMSGWEIARKAAKLKREYNLESLTNSV